MARNALKGSFLSTQFRGIFNLKQWIMSQGLKQGDNMHATVCIEQQKEYYEFENSEVEFGFQDDYEFSGKLGRGRYSEVFRGVNLLNNETCVVKILKPVKRSKIKREIQILETLQGHPYIVSLLDYVVDQSTKTPSIVMEYVRNVEFRTLYPILTKEDIRLYIWQILQGLEFAHSRGIIHRDIKPGNVLFDHYNKKIKIADWGLADFYIPHKAYNVRVASRYFKAPELLVGYQQYDYQLDVWSVGCMLAGMMFSREPFFKGADNQDQLVKIAKVVGTEEVAEYCSKYGITLDSYYDDKMFNFKKKPWDKLVNNTNEELVDEKAYDLLTKMLTIDHIQRITTGEALMHPYFDPIRIGAASFPAGNSHRQKAQKT